MLNQNELTLNEFKEVFNYLLDNNKILVDSNSSPIAIGIEGDAGIGKTTLVEDVAAERGMTLCKINLAQLEEIGDLVGMPIKEFEVVDPNTLQYFWLTEPQLKQYTTISQTGKVRTSYAPPAWLPTEENVNGTIVFLDDYTRANSMFMQATMEIINTAKYVSWKLPKYTSIVLSSNPDNGQFSVTSLDNAQKTRFINFNLKLDVNDWAKWAENNDIDGRAINFELLNGEDIFAKPNGVQIINPRSYTTFCRAISGIKNWEDPNSLALILQISKGCFLEDKNNVLGNLFTHFISNRLDKLVQPADMLKLNWDLVEPRIAECVYSGGRFRPEIASILTIRLVNYILKLFATKGGIKESVVYDRILDIINNERVLFSEDLLFHMIKILVSTYPGRTGKLLLNPKIRNKVLC